MDHINFTVCRGEITGFLSPNLSGKVNTVKILTGLLHATERHILFNDHNIRDSPTRVICREQPDLTLSPQDARQRARSLQRRLHGASIAHITAYKLEGVLGRQERDPLLAQHFRME